MSGPRTTSLVEISILTVSMEVFNRDKVVLKPLDHGVKNKLLFFELSYDPIYKS